MTLCTSKVVAEWLGLTERRVRQLRDEGVLIETKPGLYDLRSTVAKYIAFLRKESEDERTMLTRAKREAAELKNEQLRGTLHRTEDIEKGLQTVFLNIRSRFLSLPAKLSPTLAAKDGDQTAIFDELKAAVQEILEELSDYKVALAAEENESKHGEKSEPS